MSLQASWRSSWKLIENAKAKEIRAAAKETPEAKGD